MATEERASEPLFVAECGCRAYEVGDAFVFEPCTQARCEVREFVIAETKRQGKPLSFMEDVPGL